MFNEVQGVGPTCVQVCFRGLRLLSRFAVFPLVRPSILHLRGLPLFLSFVEQCSSRDHSS